MDNTKKILLDELINVAKKYNSGEWGQEKMAEYGQTLVIRNYLPITEKLTYATEIVDQYYNSDEITKELLVMVLYKTLFFRVILSGYGMVDCDNMKLWTTENYDLLYPIFAPFILQYCQEDYNNTYGFIKDSIMLYGSSYLLDSINNINDNTLTKNVEENKKMISNLAENKDMIHELSAILNYNDPSVVNTIKEIQNSILSEVKEE